MATFNSDIFGAGKPAITPDGSGPIILKATVSIPANTVLADGDLLNLALIPEGSDVLDLKLFSEDLDDDATPALVFAAGLRDDGDAALDTVFVSGSTLGQGGGTLAVPAATTMFTAGPLSSDKVLAIEITTSADGKAASAAKIGAVVAYRQRS
jgi:hypothetical protein